MPLKTCFKEEIRFDHPIEAPILKGCDFNPLEKNLKNEVHGPCLERYLRAHKNTDRGFLENEFLGRTVFF